jgi:thiol-disulfide isomerase/thioredoxin
MKIFLTSFIFLALTAGFSPLLAGEAPGPKPLTAQDFHLENYQGRVVLLDFWASWCKPCRKSLPWLAEMQDRYREHGLVVVAVNLDQKLADAAEMVAALPEEVVLVHDPDGELARQYKLEGMPSSFIFGRDGKLVVRHLGFETRDADGRESQLKQLLEEGAKNDG